MDLPHLSTLQLQADEDPAGREPGAEGRASTLVDGHSPTVTPSRTQPSAWQTSQHIKRESRHIYHRLSSVYADARFVDAVVGHFPSLPLTANLRCGAWYCRPTSTTLTSYFKSTDGHTHQWSFSLKRPNLHLIPTIQRGGGCIVVDSTTRGKSMPDALSKTVPIWCAVLNAASAQRYGTTTGWDAEMARLSTDEVMVGPSERVQIEERIAAWTQALLESDLEVPRLSKPLRPVFVTREAWLHGPPLPAQEVEAQTLPYLPIVLVSASRRVVDSTHLLRSSTPPTKHGEHRATGESELPRLYVQGAGDDHENWANGLTPTLFWQHADELLAATRDQLPQLVAELVRKEGRSEWFHPLRRLDDLDAKGKGAQAKVRGAHSGEGDDDGDDEETPRQIGMTGIFVAVSRRRRDIEPPLKGWEGGGGRFGLVVFCSAKDEAQPPSSTTTTTTTTTTNKEAVDGGQMVQTAPEDESHPERRSGPAVVHLEVPPGKRGSTGVISRAPRLIPAALSCLSCSRPILLSGSSWDHVSSFAILLLSLFYHDDTRTFIDTPEGRQRQTDVLDKDTVRRRLQWLVTALPHAAPSRTYMQRINDYLIGARYRKQ